MNIKATLVAVVALASAPVGAADADFVQNLCSKSEDGGLTVRLSSNERASRTLVFAPPAAGRILFQGTTYSDMKWLAKYESFKEVLYLRPTPESVVGLLVLVSKQGSSKRVGWLSPACWALVQAVVPGTLPTRAGSGA